MRGLRDRVLDRADRGGQRSATLGIVTRPGLCNPVRVDLELRMDAQPIPPDAPLKETLITQCPHCLSGDVVPAGRVTAARGEIRVDYQCRKCSKGFVLLR